MSNKIAELNALEESQGFTVDDPSKASWALGKLKELRKLTEQNKQLADEQIKRTQEWLDHENEHAKESIDYFESLLNEYIFAEKENDPKWKLSTPNGKLSTRKVPAKWNYNDDQAVEKLKGTDYVKTKYSINKAQLKKDAIVKDGKVILPETGEIVDGVVVEPAREKAVIKLSE